MGGGGSQPVHARERRADIHAEGVRVHRRAQINVGLQLFFCELEILDLQDIGLQSAVEIVDGGQRILWLVTVAVSETFAFEHHNQLQGGRQGRYVSDDRTLMLHAGKPMTRLHDSGCAGRTVNITRT